MTISAIDLDQAPKITLGERTFPILRLVPRQQRIVIPKLLGLMKSFTEDQGLSITNITTEQYDDLLDVVYVAIMRGTSDLTRDQFMGIEMDLLELIKAMDTVAQQTGVMKRKSEVAPGEAQAGMTALSTGTVSSPAL